MPRINLEKTNERNAFAENAKFIEEMYGKDVKYNHGWYSDGYVVTSKVYGHCVAVTTSFEPPYHSTVEGL